MNFGLLKCVLQSIDLPADGTFKIDFCEIRVLKKCTLVLYFWPKIGKLYRFLGNTMSFRLYCFPFFWKLLTKGENKFAEKNLQQPFLISWSGIVPSCEALHIGEPICRTATIFSYKVVLVVCLAQVRAGRNVCELVANFRLPL